jgi:hypothetical protein
MVQCNLRFIWGPVIILTSLHEDILAVRMCQNPITNPCLCTYEEICIQSALWNSVLPKRLWSARPIDNRVPGELAPMPRSTMDYVTTSITSLSCAFCLAWRPALPSSWSLFHSDWNKVHFSFRGLLRTVEPLQHSCRDAMHKV